MTTVDTFEVELVGGPDDGRVMYVHELRDNLKVVVPAPLPPGLLDDTGPIDPIDLTEHVVIYTLERNRANGKPRTATNGRYIYRHGQRPAPPEGVPGWLVDHIPTASRWEPRGEGRWRGYEDVLSLRDIVVFVAAILPEREPDSLTQPVAYAIQRVTQRLLDNDPDNIEAMVFDRLTEYCRALTGPSCVVPDCEDKGPVTLTAEADGRFASRQWAKGDKIDLCHRHFHEVVIDVDLYTPHGEPPNWIRVDLPTGLFYRMADLDAVADDTPPTP